jgi:hypothetical protein
MYTTIYACGEKGIMQGVASKGMLTNLAARGGASHMWQFNFVCNWTNWHLLLCKQWLPM